jgi:predicted phosphodiesterase
MTSFQIVSDLHIEYKNNEIPDPLTLITPTSEILILAGDIGSLYKIKQLQGFLEKLCIHFIWFQMIIIMNHYLCNL